jgi:hypothetical protein
VRRNTDKGHTRHRLSPRLPPTQDDHTLHRPALPRQSTLRSKVPPPLRGPHRRVVALVMQMPARAEASLCAPGSCGATARCRRSPEGSRPASLDSEEHRLHVSEPARQGFHRPALKCRQKGVEESIIQRMFAWRCSQTPCWRPGHHQSTMRTSLAIFVHNQCVQRSGGSRTSAPTASAAGRVHGAVLPVPVFLRERGGAAVATGAQGPTGAKGSNEEAKRQPARMHNSTVAAPVKFTHRGYHGVAGTWTRSLRNWVGPTQDWCYMRVERCTPVATR